jgi:hypothetical protein
MLVRHPPDGGRAITVVWNLYRGYRCGGRIHGAHRPFLLSQLGFGGRFA